MKLACSSTAFDERLRSGELTQLEWIDLCAHELSVDGIVCDVRHFPRTDTDYLAQIKKMAVDTGLTVAALRHDGFFDVDAEHMEQALETALALGAPLLSAPLPLETAVSWAEMQGRLGSATSAAKRLNVTIAIRNAPQTYAATTAGMKRVAKEADSAWLRYGPDFAALDAASEREPLAAKCVLAWHDVGAPGIEETVKTLGDFRGFLCMTDARGAATAQSAQQTLQTWRTLLK